MNGAQASTDGTRYQILALLGQGGFGKVYLASKLDGAAFRTTVALKVLQIRQQDRISPDEIAEVARRTRDEARLLGMMNHHGIVRVHGLVRLAGRWTTVMEYLRGVDLLKLSKAVPIPPAIALAVVSEAAAALHYAWHHRPEGSADPLHVLHRDIKPSNLLVTEHGRVVLLDFGAARGTFAHREADTRILNLVTEGYAAPERDHGQNVPAGDVFSLGIVLWEMICRRNYQRRALGPSTHASELDGKAEDLREVLGEASGGLPRLVADMVAWEPHQRPSAQEVRRRADELRAQWPANAFAEWVTACIPALVAERELPPPDEFVGNTYTEEPISEADFEPRPERVVVSSSPPPVEAPAGVPVPDGEVPPPPRLGEAGADGPSPPDSAARRARAGQAVPPPPALPEPEPGGRPALAGVDEESPTDPGLAGEAPPMAAESPAVERETAVLREEPPAETEPAGQEPEAPGAEVAPEPAPAPAAREGRSPVGPALLVAVLLVVGVGAAAWWTQGRPDRAPAVEPTPQGQVPPVAPAVGQEGSGHGQVGDGALPGGVGVHSGEVGPVAGGEPVTPPEPVLPAGGSVVSQGRRPDVPAGDLAVRASDPPPPEPEAGGAGGAVEVEGAAGAGPPVADPPPAAEERELAGAYQCRVDKDGAWAVRLSGPESDGAQVELPGVVPAGTWKIEVDFGSGEEGVPAGEVVIPRGLGHATIVCQQENARCRLVEHR
ncbi:MAG: protein kinase [Pseudomonadota bacterium]